MFTLIDMQVLQTQTTKIANHFLVDITEQEFSSVRNRTKYDYDAHNRRVMVDDTAGKVYQFYSQNGRLMFKSKDSNNEPSDYLYLGSRQVAKIDGVPGAQGPLTPTYITVPDEDDDGDFPIGWQPVTGATSYTLEEEVDGTGFEHAFTGAVTSTSLTGRESGVHQYRVKAINSIGDSQYRVSRFVDIQIPADPPPTPTGLNSPSCKLAGNFTVSWNSSTGATSYELDDKLYAAPFSNRYTGPNTSHTDTWGWGTWTFRVRACIDSSCSAWSSVSVTDVGPDEGCGGPPPGPWD